MSQKYLPSTSRDLDPTNYAWDSVVYQAGRPMLDSELNLTQDILNKKNTLPSGMISYQGQDDTIGSFSFQDPYVGGNPNVNFTANSFVINPFKAMVNGMVIDVRNTDATDGTNKITLPAPTLGVGPGTRGDFVFLEVWRREVTPVMQSRSRVKIKGPAPNDTLTFRKTTIVNNNPVITEVVLTAVNGAPGGNEYQIGVSTPETARNIAQVINDHAGLGTGLTVSGVTTFAETRGTEYLFLNHNGGVGGNHPTFTLVSSNNAGILVIDQPAGGSDGEGKPTNPANKIYYAGNVASPEAVWLDDNIQDANVNVSSTRRIQVQYRLRMDTLSEDLSQHIFGFENTDIVAQGSQGGPVGGYPFSRHPTDTGLWYAGNGSEAHATALGTVDGYVYAIPICYVFRRKANVGANGFNPLGAFNTGVLHNHISGGLGTLNDNDYVGNVATQESDRPDGLFSDQIAEHDVLDLRRRVYPRGVDFSAELDYQYHSLLDDTNKTWFARADNLQTTGNESGGVSHTPLVCDAFGTNAANIGTVGRWRQNFDHIARRWSNEPTTERIYIIAKPSNVAQTSTGISVAHVGGSGNFWYEGDQITIDLTTLDISGHLSWATNNTVVLPAENNTISPKLIDIGYCWHNDGHFTNAIEQQVRIQSITGLGSNQVVITLGANPVLKVNGGISGAGDYDLVGDDTNGESTGSNKEIFIELIFDYPSIDRGLSGTVAEAPMPDLSGYPTGSAVLTESAPTNAYNPYPAKGNGNAPPISNVIPNTKEVSLEYVYAQQTIQLVSSSPTSSYLPWRLYYNSDLEPTITDESGVGTDLTLNNENTNYQHAESKIGWDNSGPAWATGQRLIEITAYPLEPYPDAPTDSTIFVYYRRHAPKTVGSDFSLNVPLTNVGVGANAGGVIPDELNLQPLVIGKEIGTYLKTGEHYPFFNPTDQLATHNNASSYEEYKTLGSPEVILDDLKINTGSVSLPSFVPFVTSVNVTLGDTAVGQTPRKDNESRAFYPTMEDSSYFPSAFAKNMGGTHSNYKTTLPCLMKVVDDDHILYRKGEVVLVVFVKTNEWGQGVAVDMRDTLDKNYVAACVYRTRNQLLLGE